MNFLFKVIELMNTKTYQNLNPNPNTQTKTQYSTNTRLMCLQKSKVVDFNSILE